VELITLREQERRHGEGPNRDGLRAHAASFASDARHYRAYVS
jgi:hypothetical protein